MNEELACRSHNLSLSRNFCVGKIKLKCESKSPLESKGFAGDLDFPVPHPNPAFRQDLKAQAPARQAEGAGAISWAAQV